MLKLMKRSAMLSLAIGSLTMSQVAVAGDGHPTLNAIGRYLGAGYSHTGYQTPAGPRNIVRQMHPASNYPSSRLLAPYHASGYTQTVRPYAYPQGLAIPTIAGEAIPSQPAPPPKPAGPPPTWLEPYLDGETDPPSVEQEPKGGEIRADSPAPESSPSDREDILLFDSAGKVFQQSIDHDSGAQSVNRYRAGTFRSAERRQ